MPFTFSHPAIVLPLNYLPKRMVSLTGLVIGSITPDFEYFFRMKVLSKYSHTWPGLFWFDLPLSLLLMIIYNDVIKNNLIDHLPASINKHVSGYKNAGWPYSKYDYRVIVPSVFIGCASHIFWDGFTHPAGYFVKHIKALMHKVLIFGHSIPLYTLLQHVSTVLGVIIITFAIRKLPKRPVTTGKHVTAFWVLVASITVATVIMRLITGLKWHQFGDLIVTCVTGSLIGLLVASLAIRNKQELKEYSD